MFKFFVGLSFIIALFKLSFAYPVECMDIFQIHFEQPYQNQIQDNIYDQAHNMIDYYKSKKHVPKEIKMLEVDEILLAETRYQILAAKEKVNLVDRIVEIIEQADHDKMNEFLNKAFETGFQSPYLKTKIKSIHVREI